MTTAPHCTTRQCSSEPPVAFIFVFAVLATLPHFLCLWNYYLGELPCRHRLDATHQSLRDTLLGPGSGFSGQQGHFATVQKKKREVGSVVHFTQATGKDRNCWGTDLVAIEEVGWRRSLGGLIWKLEANCFAVLKNVASMVTQPASAGLIVAKIGKRRGGEQYRTGPKLVGRPAKFD